MSRQIKLMADYQSYPLWWSGSDQVGNINPATLPLSTETVRRLERWAETFDSWLNLDDPNSDDLPSGQEVQEFRKEGLNLWKALRQELAPDYEVVYWHPQLRRILKDPNELADEVDFNLTGRKFEEDSQIAEPRERYA